MQLIGGITSIDFFILLLPPYMQLLDLACLVFCLGIFKWDLFTEGLEFKFDDIVPAPSITKYYMMSNVLLFTFL
jgi:hypothetical protein